MQNHLWNLALPDHFAEGVHRRFTPETWRLGIGYAVHIPWWQACGIAVGELSSVDAVIINRSVFELPSNGIRFFLKFARTVLGGTEAGLHALMLTDWQDYDAPTRAKALRLLHEAGFLVICAEEGFIAATQLGRPSAIDGYELDSETIELPTLYPDRDTIVARLFASNVEAEMEWRFIPYEQLHTLSTLLLGREDYAGADERFLNFVGA